MAIIRLSKLQRYILATAWENYRLDVEKGGRGALKIYTDQIYSGYYGFSRSKDRRRYPHKFAASISRSLKNLENIIGAKSHLGGETQVIVLNPSMEVAGLCQACWKEGGLKLTGLVNIKKERRKPRKTKMADD